MVGRVVGVVYVPGAKVGAYETVLRKITTHYVAKGWNPP